MPVEQEVKGLIIAGFIIVIAIIGLFLGKLWKMTKNRGLLWFIPQLVMLSLSMFFFLQLIDNQVNVPSAMLAEENSLTVGLLSIAWGLSMIFMMLGIIGSVKGNIK